MTVVFFFLFVVRCRSESAGFQLDRPDSVCCVSNGGTVESQQARFSPKDLPVTPVNSAETATKVAIASKGRQ